MYSITKYVGFDVSKEKIAVAVADFGITSARFFGLVENSPEKIGKILKRLGKPEELCVCYEAIQPHGSCKISPNSSPGELLSDRPVIELSGLAFLRHRVRL